MQQHQLMQREQDRRQNMVLHDEFYQQDDQNQSCEHELADQTETEEYDNEEQIDHMAAE